MRIKGYFWKRSNETIEQAMSDYEPGHFPKTIKQCRDDIKLHKHNGYMSKRAQPKIYRITIQVCK